jgi:flavin-dependent dehydrogenase
MDSCDVLIVGGGPAGSSCAWGLKGTVLDTVVLDRCIFPRDKVCGGWITPAALDEIEIDTTEYASSRVLQPITGFLTGRMGGHEIQTDYGRPVSFGIRRREFDEFLLQRCGARIFQGMPLTTLERSAEHWVVNGRIKARLVVGAGGHFCPVARFLRSSGCKERAVAAQEVEFEMTSSQNENCSIRPEVPELYFCPDMRGYGWCFRKQNFLNVGLGRLDPHALPKHVSAFVDFLRRTRKLTFDLPVPMSGHAYLLHAETKRKVADDNTLLIGDAAGLAYSQSGEGIRPAIESGLLAAQVIIAADGKYNRENLENYNALLAARFGKSQNDWSGLIGQYLPAQLVSCVARILLANCWFSRHVVLDRWFLHRTESALQFPGL